MRLFRRPSGARVDTSSGKVDTLVTILTETVGTWTHREAVAYIERDYIPQPAVDAINGYVAKHPELIVVSDEEFIAAMLRVRPDLAAELQTERGRIWLRRVPGMLAGSFLRSIFTPGRSLEGGA